MSADFMSFQPFPSPQSPVDQHQYPIAFQPLPQYPFSPYPPAYPPPPPPSHLPSVPPPPASSHPGSSLMIPPCAPTPPSPLLSRAAPPPSPPPSFSNGTPPQSPRRPKVPKAYTTSDFHNPTASKRHASSSSSHNHQDSPETTRLLKQLLSLLTNTQSTVTALAARNSILEDRLSLLEQRTGRLADTCDSKLSNLNSGVGSILQHVRHSHAPERKLITASNSAREFSPEELVGFSDAEVVRYLKGFGFDSAWIGTMHGGERKGLLGCYMGKEYREALDRGSDEESSEEEESDEE